MIATSKIGVRALLAVTASLLTASLAHAGTLLVPAQYATIQDAVDAAVAGDVVRIADGTYTGVGNRGINTLGKAITIRSASLSPALCVIDCEGADRGFLLNSGEGLDTVIEGLTITNGFADFGGAIYCVGASPTVRNCRIIANSTLAEGAGIALEQSEALIRNCFVTSNQTPGIAGGGGGISIKDFSTPTVDTCLIQGNLAYSGGGIFISDSDPIIVDCFILGNDAQYGGGVWASTGNARLANCRIGDNDADIDGGGIYVTVTEIRLVNCRVIANNAFNDGGGLCSYATSTIRIFNSTFMYNEAGNVGDGIANVSFQGQFPSDVTIKNSIIRGGGAPIDNVDASTYDLAYSNVEGGFVGAGNIDADPLFIDPDGTDDNPQTVLDNDFRLSPGSPCIDAGDNDALPADLLDLDGDGDTSEPFSVDAEYRPRFVDDLDSADTGNGTAPIVDMGAFEYQYCAADLDGDGDTDQADLGVLLAAYGQTGGGDLDGDGDTDQADLGVLLADYGCEP